MWVILRAWLLSNTFFFFGWAQDCPLKIVICRFCFQHLPAGPPVEDASDRALGLTQHEAVCGSKTEECARCGKRIRLKEMDTHQRLHEVGAFNTSTTTHDRPSNSTYIARPQSPKSLLRARNEAWARAGYEPMDLGPDYGDARVDREDSDLEKAIAASLVEQQISRRPGRNCVWDRQTPDITGVYLIE